MYVYNAKFVRTRFRYCAIVATGAVLLIYWLIYLLTPCSKVLLEKLTGLQLVKKFPTLYGIWRLITAFTSARQMCLSWASSIESIPPHPTYWRFVLILSSHLCRATCFAHLVLYLVTRIILGEEYRSLNSSVCSFLHFLISSSLLGPNILTPYSQTQVWSVTST
jgi:hypothetical protein